VPEGVPGVVVLGDVIDSRRAAAASTAFLRGLIAEMEACYPDALRLASPGIAQGDELQALLTIDADPFAIVLRAGVRADARRMRWVVAAGEVDPGHGPATERTGPAFLFARALMERAKPSRDRLLVETGDPDVDPLLADLAPLLPRLLADLTARQREVARAIVLDGLRRAEVAARLGISRATVSVMADRARVRELAGLARALATLFRAGASRDGAVPSGSDAVTPGSDA